MSLATGYKIASIVGVTVREKQKDTGVYYVFVSRGSERCAHKCGAKDKAERLAQEIRKELRLGQFQFPKHHKLKSPTLSEYWKHFKKEYVELTCRPSTQRIYDNSFDFHIIPELGGRSLHLISKSTVRNFVAVLSAKNLAKDSIRLIIMNLSKMLNMAIEDDLIKANPAAKMGSLYKEAPTRHEDIQPLTADEVPVFLAKVAEWSPQYFCLFLCAIHTGMREGEIAGLQWADIDRNGKYALVKRTIYQGRIGKVKNSRIRRVDLSDALISELKKHLEEQRMSFEELPEWVFPNHSGNPIDMHNVIQRHFHPALEKAGLRRIRFHDLRHTYASLMIQQNEASLAYIQQQMGHSSIKVTVDVYGHLVPGANRGAVNKLPSIAGPKAESGLKVIRRKP